MAFIRVISATLLVTLIILYMSGVNGLWSEGASGGNHGRPRKPPQSGNQHGNRDGRRRDAPTNGVRNQYIVVLKVKKMHISVYITYLFLCGVGSWQAIVTSLNGQFPNVTPAVT